MEVRQQTEKEELQRLQQEVESQRKESEEVQQRILQQEERLQLRSLAVENHLRLLLAQRERSSDGQEARAEEAAEEVVMVSERLQPSFSCSTPRPRESHTRLPQPGPAPARLPQGGGPPPARLPQHGPHTREEGPPPPAESPQPRGPKTERRPKKRGRSRLGEQVKAGETQHNPGADATQHDTTRYNTTLGLTPHNTTQHWG